MPVANLYNQRVIPMKIRIWIFMATTDAEVALLYFIKVADELKIIETIPD